MKSSESEEMEGAKSRAKAERAQASRDKRASMLVFSVCLLV